MFELLTPTEMAEADRLAIHAGRSGMELMEQAGLAVADAVTRRHPSGAPQVRIVAGPGNNGGDGFVAARVLAARGFPVRVLLLGDRSALRGDAAEAAGRWPGPTDPATPDGLAFAGLIVDALFGAGLDRPVQGVARALIEAMNASGAPIVSVDLPSGIHGGTGAVMGAAVQATETVTFFRRKPGHLLLPGRLHCGLLQVVDIGIPADVIAAISPKRSVNGPALWEASFPVPRVDGHKYSRGHAVVCSGHLTSTGAARLAARGALRAGAGLVTVASPADALAVNAAANLSVMVRQVDDAAALTALLKDRRLNAAVLGPGAGVGPRTREMVLAALAAECSVVLDADALTTFAADSGGLFSAIRSMSSAAVLTPHLGEFARIFGNIAETTETKGKCAAALEAAVASGAVVVLKGPDTVVACPDGRATIADNAPPWLATGGSGDVLAGITAGLLAQGMPAFEAAAAAVWLHGEAARAFGPGLIAEDLPDALPGVYRRLFTRLVSRSEPDEATPKASPGID